MKNVEFFLLNGYTIKGPRTTQGIGLQNEDVLRAYLERTRVAYYEDRCKIDNSWPSTLVKIVVIQEASP